MDTLHDTILYFILHYSLIRRYSLCTSNYKWYHNAFLFAPIFLCISDHILGRDSWNGITGSNVGGIFEGSWQYIIQFFPAIICAYLYSCHTVWDCSCAVPLPQWVFKKIENPGNLEGGYVLSYFNMAIWKGGTFLSYFDMGHKRWQDLYFPRSEGRAFWEWGAAWADLEVVKVGSFPSELLTRCPNRGYQSDWAYSCRLPVPSNLWRQLKEMPS